MNDIRELDIAELDNVSAGDEKPKNPLPKLPEDPVVTVINVLGGAIWFPVYPVSAFAHVNLAA